MRDESRTLDFRLKFSTYRKRRAGEPAVHPGCIPAVNVTEKPQLEISENAPSVKLVTETVKFSQTGPFILRDGLVAVGADKGLSPGCLAGLQAEWFDRTELESQD